jgi:hypothetical protein
MCLVASTKNYEAKKAADYKTEIGVDAKIAVTSSLNLDLTVNPDFSQVEVDRQVTILIAMNFSSRKKDNSF